MKIRNEVVVGSVDDMIIKQQATTVFSRYVTMRVFPVQSIKNTSWQPFDSVESIKQKSKDMVMEIPKK